MPVAPPIAATLATAKADEAKTKNALRDPRRGKTEEAGKGFEAIFVRQMLQSANVAGKSGYADMAVEAIASAVTAGGGIGLARAIEDALAKHRG